MNTRYEDKSTEDLAREAFIDCLRAGESPTIARIRARIGGGGTELISRVVRTMKAELATAMELPKVPAEIVGQMTALWNAAVATARDMVSAEETRLAAEVEALTIERDADRERIASLQEGSERLATDLEGLQELLEQRETSLAAETARAKQAEAVAGELAGQLADLAASRDALQLMVEGLKQRIIDADQAHVRALAKAESDAARERSELSDKLRSDFDLERKLYERNAAMASAAIRTANERVEALETDTINVERALQVSKDEQTLLLGKIAELESANDVLRRNETEIRRELRQKGERLDHALGENVTLKQRLRRSTEG